MNTGKPSARDLLKKAFAHKDAHIATENHSKDQVDADKVDTATVIVDVEPGEIAYSNNEHEVDLQSDFVGSHHYSDDNNLQPPQLSHLDDLVDAATRDNIFFDDPTLGFNTYNYSDGPPVSDDSVGFIEKSKADADKDGKNTGHLEVIISEQHELEEIMRQQLLKQQQEEAEKLNEGIERIRSRHENFLGLLKNLHSLELDDIAADNIINIVQDFRENQSITLQSYLLINRKIHKHKLIYDLNEIRVFLNEDLLDISTPPLDFDYYYLWESDLNKKITPYMWDKYKMVVFDQANYVCELCGGTGEHNPVELHPNWKLFDSSRIQILHTFLALCPKCVDAKNHKKLKDRGLKMRYESAREHIKAVNNWDDRQVEQALCEAEDMYKRRVDQKAEPERFKKWKLNILALEPIFNIKIDEPKFNQRSHIKSVHHHIFEDHLNYLFRKIESDRMIKTGKTKFISLKLSIDKSK